MDYETKIVELEKTLLRLEDETAKVEAELRSLIHCLKLPDSYPEPEWFKKEIKELTDHFQIDLSVLGNESALRSEIKTASKLIRLLNKEFDGKLPEAELSVELRSALEINWGPQLTWLIYESKIRWPACHVRQYRTNNRRTTFWYSKSLITSSTQALKE